MKRSSNQSPVAPALTIQLADGVDMTFQEIPAGEFRMGSRGEYANEEPIHQVRIEQPFYLGTFPVTQAQYSAFRPDHKNYFPENPDHPAEQVSWDDAIAFCDWLNVRFGKHLPDGCRVSLPTEAHWEYACRAGTETGYNTGDGAAALIKAGWFDVNSLRKIHSVGSRQPNNFGLYDMHGNVWEWCRDKFDSACYRRLWDGITANEIWLLNEINRESPGRVIRGGSWFGEALDCRSAYRIWSNPDSRYGFQGFRVSMFSGPMPGQAEAEQRAATTRDEEEPANRDDGARELFLNRESMPRQ